MSSPRALFAASLPLAFAITVVTSCAEPAPPREPLGHMPTAVTSAQPEWIPFSIRAGELVPPDPRERHLTEIRRLTFAKGENAEAYWSPDGRSLVFQATRDGSACDQIYVMDLGSGETRRISKGGRTTCAFFVYPSGDRLLYASTHALGPSCPPKPDRSQGYVWALDPFDLYTAKLDGSDLKPLLPSPGYDAEATFALDGSRMVFTSTRDGDLEIYTARPDGTELRRITNAPGYDGGAFFSPDGSRLVWRAGRPEGAALDEYRALLAKGLVKPTALEIWVASAEGQGARAITKNGKASFAPAFLPDSRRVIFSSNVDAAPPERGRAPNFDLYVVDPDAPPSATGMPALERITHYDGFDGFPMFSPDGKHLAFASNRHGSAPGETNLYVARWVE